MKRIHAEISEKNKKILEREARERGLTRQAMAGYALRRWLNAQGTKKEMGVE